MSQSTMPEPIIKHVRDLLEETFEKVNGIYLDKGTSFLETLDDVSAAEASTPLASGGSTIAGHTEHTRFYLRVLEDYIAGRPTDNIDWKQSWLVTTVNDAEWVDLKEKLREDYLRLSKTWSEFESWSDERRFGGALAVIVHTSYHLGAIRQIIKIAKA